MKDYKRFRPGEYIFNILADLQEFACMGFGYHKLYDDVDVVMEVEEIYQRTDISKFQTYLERVMNGEISVPGTFLEEISNPYYNKTILVPPFVYLDAFNSSQNGISYDSLTGERPRSFSREDHDTHTISPRFRSAYNYILTDVSDVSNYPYIRMEATSPFLHLCEMRNITDVMNDGEDYANQIYKKVRR